MKEYIEREALAQRIVSEQNANAKTLFYESQYGIGYHNGLTMACSMVLNAPYADVVEVVRCKDCKRCVQFENELICNHALPTKSLAQYLQMGTNIMAIVKPDDFCSYGERR